MTPYDKWVLVCRLCRDFFIGGGLGGFGIWLSTVEITFSGSLPFIHFNHVAHYRLRRLLGQLFAVVFITLGSILEYLFIAGYIRP